MVRWFLYKSLRGYTGFVLLGCGILVCFLYHSHTVFIYPQGNRKNPGNSRKYLPKSTIFQTCSGTQKRIFLHFM